MKRRKFLKTLALGAASAPMVVKAAASLPSLSAVQQARVVPFWYQTSMEYAYYSPEYVEKFGRLMKKHAEFLPAEP